MKSALLALLIVGIGGCRRVRPDQADASTATVATSRALMATGTAADGGTLLALSMSDGGSDDERDERRAAIAKRRAASVVAPCEVAPIYRRNQPFRAKGAQFELQIEMPRVISAPQVRRIEEGLPTELTRLTLLSFDDDPYEKWKNCAACDSEYASSGFVSWRCEFDYLPAGAYPPYQVVGLNAVVDPGRVRFIDPLKECDAPGVEKLTRSAVEALRAHGRHEVAQTLLQTTTPLRPSAYRTANGEELALSFTRDLPHVLQGEGVVVLPLKDVQAVCGSLSPAFR